MSWQININPKKKILSKPAWLSLFSQSLVLLSVLLSLIIPKKDVPLILYAIFGGGVLGTDNVLKFIKAIFRINDDK